MNSITSSSFFTVQQDSLLRLDPKAAVEIFRDMLHAEAMRLGVPISRVHISTSIYVPDGGIDASVDEGSLPDGLIKSGRTSYQIKAGDDFKPWQDSAIRKELFGSKPPCRENLGKSVRDCMQLQGCYVLVCVKKELAESEYRDSIAGLKNHLEQCEFQNPRVDVWSTSNLVGFLSPFPSLALRVNGFDRTAVQSHKSWSQQEDMLKAFESGPDQVVKLEGFQKALRSTNDAIHIRVLGDAGIGKTRLILEATKPDDLNSLVLYFDSAIKFRDSDLMNQLTREDNLYNCILVLDECDLDSSTYIWNKLKNCGSRVRLISVYNEYERESAPINYIEPSPLKKEEVSKIIQSYSVPLDEANRWALLCSGSPRMAHVIGLNLKMNPGDVLKNPDTVNVWERSVVGYDDPKDEVVRQRRVTLRYIALFKRFGFGRPVVEEAKAIAKLVEAVDRTITWGRFQEIVKQLRERKILQGENTLYITPKALHVKLWTEWWETYGGDFSLVEFQGLSSTLRSWFYEMFEFARESAAANRIVRELLGESGPLRDFNALNSEERSSFFLALANANPNAALNCLEATIRGRPIEELRAFEAGRRNIVWALERIAMWRECFTGAAKLLLSLGEAENESWSNNASGIFAGLFAVGLAPTEASPEERFPLLVETVKSESSRTRDLGFNACDVALESYSFTRMIGAEYQGLRAPPKLWTPKHNSEIVEAYLRVWNLLSNSILTFTKEEQQRAGNILVHHARSLCHIEPIAETIVSSIRTLVRDALIERRNALELSVQVLHYDRSELPATTLQLWESLRDELTGESYPSLLKRYVGMSLLEDQYDEQGNRIDASEKLIASLAKESCDDKNLLYSELHWLVTEKAENGLQFGYHLGRVDDGFSLLTAILEEQVKSLDNRSFLFLSGYFRSMFEQDTEFWEMQLDHLTVDENLCKLVPELTFRSGMTDVAASRVLNLAKAGKIKVNELRMFTYGSVLAKISEDVFRDWMAFLEAGDRDALSIALNLFHFYYLRDKEISGLPEAEAKRLLIHPALFASGETRSSNGMDEYYWTGIGLAYFKNYSAKTLDIAGLILEHFGEERNILGQSFSKTDAVINAITKEYPVEVWSIVKKYLGPPSDSRSFWLRQWLRGGEHYQEKKGILSFIPIDLIWDWVDEDVQNRAWYVAGFVPNRLFTEEGETCLAREVLVQYGDRDDVRRNLMSNFMSEGWIGPESMHYREKKEQLLSFKEKESNDRVRLWIDEFVESLNQYIERAKLEEERENY